MRKFSNIKELKITRDCIIFYNSSIDQFSVSSLKDGDFVNLQIVGSVDVEVCVNDGEETFENKNIE